MKQTKKLTYELKRKLDAKGYDVGEWRLVEEKPEYYILKNVISGEYMEWLKKGR